MSARRLPGVAAEEAFEALLARLEQGTDLSPREALAQSFDLGFAHALHVIECDIDASASVADLSGEGGEDE